MKWLSELLTPTKEEQQNLPSKQDEPHQTIQHSDTTESTESTEFEAEIATFATHDSDSFENIDNLEINISNPTKMVIDGDELVRKLEDLVEGHQQWCVQMEQIMRQNQTNQLELNDVGDNLLCCIGQWLQDEHHRLKNYPEYFELVGTYQTFQKCASTMLNNHREGRLIDAICLLRGEFTELSRSVQIFLLNLIAVILHENTNSKISPPPSNTDT